MAANPEFGIDSTSVPSATDAPQPMDTTPDSGTRATDEMQGMQVDEGAEPAQDALVEESNAPNPDEPAGPDEHGNQYPPPAHGNPASKSGISLRSMPWPTVDSDPGAFYGMLRDWGVKGADIVELWSTDTEDLPVPKGRVRGLILCFQQEETVVTGRPEIAPERLFFTNQTVPNACATYGLLNIILNLQGTAIERGSLVDSFYDFVSNMTPQMRGHVVSNSTEFYKVHAAHGRASEIVAIRKHTFETSDETGAQPQPQQLQQPQQKEQQQNDEDSGADKELNDPFHFVSFVGVPAEHEHEVWKLDGLQMHPEVVDSMLKGQEDLWVDKALQRMAETMNAARLESFSILALCDDDVTERQEVAAALAAICSHVESRLASSIFGSKSLAENLLEMDWNKVANAAPIIEMMADLDEAGLRKVVEKLLPAEREERVYVAEKLAQRKKWDQEQVERHQLLDPAFNALFHILARRGLLGNIMEGRLDTTNPEQLEWAKLQIEQFGGIQDEVPKDLLAEDQKMTVKEKTKKEAEEAKKNKKARK